MAIAWSVYTLVLFYLSVPLMALPWLSVPLVFVCFFPVWLIICGMASLIWLSLWRLWLIVSWLVHLPPHTSGRKPHLVVCSCSVTSSFICLYKQEGIFLLLIFSDHQYLVYAVELYFCCCLPARLFFFVLSLVFLCCCWLSVSSSYQYLVLCTLKLVCSFFCVCVFLVGWFISVMI